MQSVRKFSISSPTTQKDQMSLSNIFSASTSNAHYKPKIVMENNSSTQPQKITAVHNKTPEPSHLDLEALLTCLRRDLRGAADLGLRRQRRRPRCRGSARARARHPQRSRRRYCAGRTTFSVFCVTFRQYSSHTVTYDHTLVTYQHTLVTYLHRGVTPQATLLSLYPNPLLLF